MSQNSFNHILNVLTGAEHPVTVFTVEQDEFPEFFFNDLNAFLFRRLKKPFEKIIIDQESSQELKRKLQTSFLGTTIHFWVVNYHTLAQKDKNEWYDFFASYNGPHTVGLLAKEKEVSTFWQHCFVPKQMNYALFRDFLSCIESKDTLQTVRFTEKIFKRYRAVSLDQAMLLANYAQLLGPRTDDFLEEWASKLIKDEYSLFTLAELFLFKKKEQFFAYWYTVKELYSEQFWLSFWADLCWRSMWYTRYMRANDMEAVKKAKYRLPFKFIQYGWQHCSTKALVSMHDCLYSMDFSLKNGGTSYFELLFLDFFNTPD